MKIKCVNCGEYKGVSAKRYQNLIAKHSSEEVLKTKYKCRRCRKKKLEPEKPQKLIIVPTKTEEAEKNEDTTEE